MNFSVTKSSLYDYLFCLLILVIPFSLKIPNIVLIVLIVFFIIDFKKIKELDFRKLIKSPYIILGLLLSYWIFKGLITGTINENKYGLLLPIIVIPILILKIQDFYKLLFAIIVCGFIIATRALYGTVSNYLSFGEFLPFEGKSINQILNMDRPYLGFFLLISTVVAFFLAFKFPKLKFGLSFYNLYVITIIFLISARMALLTLVLILFIYFVFYIKIGFKKRAFYFAIVLFILAIIVSINKNVQDRFFINVNYQQSVKNFERYEPRFFIWPCSFSIAKSPTFNILFGIPSEKKLDKLLGECYLDKMENKHRANFFVETELNTHNQFVGTYLTSGLIGALLLVAFFIIQFYNIRKNFYKTSLIIALLMFFIVENVLYRQVGVYFFGLVLILVNSFDFLEEKKELKSSLN